MKLVPDLQSAIKFKLKFACSDKIASLPWESSSRSF